MSNPIPKIDHSEAAAAASAERRAREDLVARSRSPAFIDAAIAFAESLFKVPIDAFEVPRLFLALKNEWEREQARGREIRWNAHHHSESVGDEQRFPNGATVIVDDPKLYTVQESIKIFGKSGASMPCHGVVGRVVERKWKRVICYKKPEDWNNPDEMSEPTALYRIDQGGMHPVEYDSEQLREVK